MTSLDRGQVLKCLQEDWAAYVQQFKDLPPDVQAAFLKVQGYRRFADLLAHIIAWWEAGIHSIKKYLTDPGYQPAEYDVDAFNGEAVVKASGMDDAGMIDRFERMREYYIGFVKALPDAAFENEKVVKQLNMELVGHLKEHSVLQSA